jgi:hypothetical protein
MTGAMSMASMRPFVAATLADWSMVLVTWRAFRRRESTRGPDSDVLTTIRRTHHQLLHWEILEVLHGHVREETYTVNEGAPTM